MAVLLTLVFGSLAARVVGWLGVDYVDSWPRAIAIALAAMFVMTGVAHFVEPLRGDMIAIVPPSLPAPALLVTATGVLELLGAVGLLLPATRVAAAICLLLLMLALMLPCPAAVLCRPHAEPAEVNEFAAVGSLSRGGRLPGRCGSGRGLQWLDQIASLLNRLVPQRSRRFG